MKRVAIFSITYDPFIGGAEVAIKEITNRLSEEFEFDLFTARINPSLPDQERIGNVNVYRVGIGHSFFDKLLYPFRASRFALNMHAKNPYNIIHAVLETYAGLGAILFKKKAIEVPYILTLQSGDSDLFIWLRTWFWYPWYRMIFIRADKIVAISNWLGSRAKKYGYKKHVEIIPNGVDIENFTMFVSSQEREFVRKTWGAKDGDAVIFTSSRLVRKNGIDILIEAMNYLSENFFLIIAGSGKDESKLKSMASKFGSRIVFLGYIPHSGLPLLLKSSDVFVRPSRTEGLGNSFIEARIAGLPSLGTLVGGIKDLISFGIVEPISQNNPKCVADKIKEVLGSNKKISESLPDSVIQKYSWENITSQYVNEYKKLLKENNV